MPSVLLDFGWLEAIEDLCSQFSQIDIVMNVSPKAREKAIRLENQVHIYRIFQEALTNSCTHGECQRIAIDIEEVNNEILITISDDGKGFSVDRNKMFNEAAFLISG